MKVKFKNVSIKKKSLNLLLLFEWEPCVILIITIYSVCYLKSCEAGPSIVF